MVVHPRPLLRVVLLLVLLAASTTVPAPPRALTGADVSAFALYAAPHEQPYVPVDPETLADVPGGMPIDFGEPFPDWLLSADGSTLVHIEHDVPVTIVVSDGLGGAERLHFQPPVPVFAQHLSRDGTRLVTQIPMSCSPTGCSRPVWYVFDTRDGHLITRVEGDEGGYGPGSLIDPEARRLYRLAFDRGDDREGPWPLQIVAYDLTTGVEVDRLAVPGVRAGIWYVRSVGGAPVADVLMPAVALSPDGGRLAIIGADADRMTLIDAATLTVEDTHALARPEGLAHRLFRWLGIVPETAEAKFMAGRRLEAVFAPDGRHLYVWGVEGKVGQTVEEAELRGLGLRLIDAETGDILAEALEGAVFVGVLPAPDGRGVYANGPAHPRPLASDEPPYRLRRLDAHSLETLAEREFPKRQTVTLVPVVPTAR